jgi:hypothetical protein
LALNVAVEEVRFWLSILPCTGFKMFSISAITFISSSLSSWPGDVDSRPVTESVSDTPVAHNTSLSGEIEYITLSISLRDALRHSSMASTHLFDALEQLAGAENTRRRS